MITLPHAPMMKSDLMSPLLIAPGAHTALYHQNASIRPQSVIAADKHLYEKKQVKFKRQDMVDNDDNHVTADENASYNYYSAVTKSLFHLPSAHEDVGDPSLTTFYPVTTQQPLRCPSDQLPFFGTRMYNRVISPTSQVSLIPHASSQLFYRHSWTTPTPKEYAYQHLGIVISTLAQHLRDAKRGQLMASVP